MSKWIEIFRAGKHTDSNGIEHVYTDADIERTAALYKERKVDAPLVLGHPKGNGPAHGWIADLKADAGKLLMQAKDVTSDLATWVDKKMYKYVSPSLYPDGRIRHLGFLGDTPPAVKDLPAVAFMEFGDDQDSFTFDYSADRGARYHIETVGNVLRRIKNLFISKFSLEEVEDVIPEWMIDSLKEAANIPEEEKEQSMIPSFSEGKSNKKETDMTLEEAQKMINDLNAQIQNLNGQVSEFSESKIKLDQLEADRARLLKEKEDRTKKDIADFMETDGKAVPAKLKAPLSTLLFQLTTGDAVVEFAEGSETKKENAAGVVMELIKSKGVPLGEFGKRTAAGGSDVDTSNFAEHGTVDEEREAIYKRAKAIEKEQNISFSEAVGIAMAQEGGI